MYIYAYICGITDTRLEQFSVGKIILDAFSSCEESMSFRILIICKQKSIKTSVCFKFMKSYYLI